MVSFGDNILVVETALTEELGLAERIGQVLDKTTPSITGVDVVGELKDDCAIAVQFDGISDSM